MPAKVLAICMCRARATASYLMPMTGPARPRFWPMWLPCHSVWRTQKEFFFGRDAKWFFLYSKGRTGSLATRKCCSFFTDYDILTLDQAIFSTTFPTLSTALQQTAPGDQWTNNRNGAYAWNSCLNFLSWALDNAFIPTTIKLPISFLWPFYN